MKSDTSSQPIVADFYKVRLHDVLGRRFGHMVLWGAFLIHGVPFKIRNIIHSSTSDMVLQICMISLFANS